MNISNIEWKKVLSKDLYQVARGKNTERSFTGKYWKSDAKAKYYCAACGNLLFESEPNLQVVVAGQASTSLQEKIVSGTKRAIHME